MKGHVLGSENIYSVVFYLSNFYLIYLGHKINIISARELKDSFTLLILFIQADPSMILTGASWRTGI